MKSVLSGIVGALVGIFLCALIGVNFSKGIETSSKAEELPMAESQPAQSLSDSMLQNAATQANLQRIQAQLNFCQSELAFAKLDALQKQVNGK